MSTLTTDGRKVNIVLGQSAVRSTVAIDGVDITSALVGVEVKAHVGSLTEVKLFLSAAVELTGEAGEVLKSIPELRLKSVNPTP